MKVFFRGCLAALALLALPHAVLAGVIAERQGTWLGEMAVPSGAKIRIGADLFIRADGLAWASIAVPDQGEFNVPVTAVQETSEGITLQFDQASLDLKWDADHFNGTFQETGGPALSFPLVAVSQFPSKALPQTPKGPFPYHDETLAISSADGVTLGGTLSIPQGVAKPNAVVLVHGAGPQTRDQDGTFLVLADYLARQGIAVLRYDKRGIARSTGDYAAHTADDLATDLGAAIQTLRARGGFDRIGVVGHSEGPGVAAMLARRSPQAIDFLVSLAGVGLPGLDMMLLQDRAAARVHGANVAEMERMLAYSRRYYEVIIAHSDATKRTEALKALSAARSPEELALAKRLGLDGGSLSVEKGFGDKEFLRAMLMADTPRDWRAVRFPVLALNGSLDTQVPVESLQGIVASLEAGGNKSVRFALLPSLNHRFQTATTGAEDEYDTLPETFAPAAMKRVAAFISEQGVKRPATR